MVQINVDTRRLEDLSRECDQLRFEFDGIEDRVGDHSDAVGRNGRLTDAIEDVVGNWSDRRGEVLGELEALANLALEAARFYERREREVSAGFGESSGARA